MIRPGTEILIIGYGNELRGDDGLGPYLAAQIDAQQLPGVQVLRTHQLTPELASLLAEVPCGLFVDASATQAEAVQICPVQPGNLDVSLTHHATPGGLLAMAQGLYGRAPQAWWLTVRGENYGWHVGFSAAAQRNADEALRQVAQWLMEAGVTLRN